MDCQLGRMARPSTRPAWVLCPHLYGTNRCSVHSICSVNCGRDIYAAICRITLLALLPPMAQSLSALNKQTNENSWFVVPLRSGTSMYCMCTELLYRQRRKSYFSTSTRAHNGRDKCGISDSLVEAVRYVRKCTRG